MSKKPKPNSSPSSSSSSSSGDKIGGNEDLIREILPHLPARSLTSFQSVSKQWRSLITDPHFGLLHSLRHKNNLAPTGIFFYNSLTNSQQIESAPLTKTPNSKPPSLHQPQPPSSDESIRLVQSTNGLDLFRLISVSDGNIKLYCVRNSTTRKWRLIPPPDISTTLVETVVNCALAFDPSKSPHYKIVCVKEVKYNPCRFDVFSSETNEWRTTSVTTTRPWRMEFDNGVYWNGAVYWIRERTMRLEYYRFDMEEESLRIMNMPPKPQDCDDGFFRYFGEFNGHLHLVYVRSRAAKRFNVLEMDRDTLTWFVKYRVHISRLITPFPEVVVKAGKEYFENEEETQYAFSILCVKRGESEEDSALVMTIPGKVVSYSFVRKTVEVLAELPSKDVDISHFHHVSAYPFVPTLYPL